MESTLQKRLTHMDLLRFVTIFFMMMTHVASRGGWHTEPVTSQNWMALNIYDSLVRFSVPVFVMISGVFFLDPKKPLTFQKLFGKYLLRIGTAFLFWSFAYAAAINLIQYRELSFDCLLHIAADTVAGRYHLWFLYMIAALYLITPLLRKITEDKKLCEYFLILCVVFGMTVPALRLLPMLDRVMEMTVDKMHLHFVLGYVGAFVSGYYFHTYGISKKLKIAVYTLGILSVPLTAAGTYLLSVQAGEPVDLLYNNFLPTTYCTALAIFLLFCDIGKKHVFSEKSASVCKQLSALSFGMYLIHDFVLLGLEHVFGITATSFHSGLAVPAITLVVFIVSAAAVWLLRKIPLVSKYIT